MPGTPSGIAGINENATMVRQRQLLSGSEEQEYKRALRSLRFSYATDAISDHELSGTGSQGILRGAHAVDFGSADGRGRWRLVYDKYPDETFLVHGIIDYHGGGAHVPLYRMSSCWIDLSDGGANGIQGEGR